MKLSGNKGVDFIYYVTTNRIAYVLRAINFYTEKRKKNRLNLVGKPFIRLDSLERIEREYLAYKTLSKYNLAPNVELKGNDFLLVSYLPFPSLHQLLLEDINAYWEYAFYAQDAINKMHSVGITHMDISFTNILFDKTEKQPYFIDFEFSSAKTLNFNEQCLYDSLKLLESTYKNITPEIFDLQIKKFLDSITSSININELRHHSLEVIRETLPRIFENFYLKSFFSSLLNVIDTRDECEN